MKPKNKNSIYERKYDTTEESKISPFKRSILNRITLHMPNKIVKMQDPEFASTDTQRFVLTYKDKKFIDKLKKIAEDVYDDHNMKYLPLQKVDADLNFKNNAAFTGNKFIYNGRVDDKFFPTFADVMAHEVGHLLDRNFYGYNGSYNNPSYIYPPFVENNSDLYNINRFSKHANEITNLVTNNLPGAYSVYHDAYPSEIFADLISDKYRMNVNNIYNSLGNVPFTENHYKAYSDYLKRTTGYPWSRAMYKLIKPGENYDLPSKEVYTKAMNDL